MGTPGKRVSEQSFRGFESLSIRHFGVMNQIAEALGQKAFSRWVKNSGRRTEFGIVADSRVGEYGQAVIAMGAGSGIFA